MNEPLYNFVKTNYQLDYEKNITKTGIFHNFFYSNTITINNVSRTIKEKLLAMTDGMPNETIEELINLILEENKKPYLYINKVKVNDKFHTNFYILININDKINYIPLKVKGKEKSPTLDFIIQKYEKLIIQN